MTVLDARGRALRDLRVSVTDRCNFRCTYCMPREVFGADHGFVPRAELLTFEEIARVVSVFASRGVDTVRLTGGEPLLRRDLPTLIQRLAAIDGVDDVALTTNGVLLAGVARDLAAAGLRRVTVSLDAVDPAVFAAMADTTAPLSAVLDGIQAAAAAGVTPIKINAVIRRGVNESQIVPLVQFGRENGYVVRFIEYMDVGVTNGWTRADVVTAEEIHATVDAAFPLEPLAASRPGETARRYAFSDGSGEIGIIASVTAPFCGACTRARLSPVGELFTCLFGNRGADLRALLRDGATDEELGAFIDGVWTRRDDRYSELRATAAARADDRVEMSYIGG